MQPPPGTRRISRIPPRGIVINGHPTSIRLEPSFWEWLREISMECGLTTKALIEGIVATKNPKWPLTSALRLYIAQYFRNRDGAYYMQVDQLRGTRRAHRKQEEARNRRMDERAQTRS